ncbi:MAG: hypothetical protein COT84_07115 [Chlamydiae bacterium CG10_big_fil_rev_8_21_14_0_10_35_9]|nr:MAG: hypothetical protein COT84_07115 [Chlamydiae bacterium CG10_big_fil_rev_8_21_14_0_10_35_9]
MNHKKSKKISLRRLLPLAILLILMLTAYFLGVTDYLSFEKLKENRILLKNYVETHFIIASLLFVTGYIGTTALSIPGATIVTILGGFLFGQPLATIYAVVGATIGASLIFLAAKTALGEFFREKTKGYLEKMKEGFQQNAISYLLFLRLVPIFPFWLVNIAPAFFKVSLITFSWTTFVGIIPGTFVYSQAGAGLGAILDEGKEFSINAIFNWPMRIALLALGLFALIPIIVKKIRKKKHKRND